MLADRAPAVHVSELGDNAVALELRAWCNGADWVQTRFDLIECGKQALEAAGVTIPFPQRDLHIKDMPKYGSPKDGEPKGSAPSKSKKRKSAA